MESKICVPAAVAEEIPAKNNLLHPKYQEVIYQMVVDSASDVIHYDSQTGTILYVNRTTEKVFGYAAGELIGENLTMLVPEKFRASYQARIARYLTSGRHIFSESRSRFPPSPKTGVISDRDLLRRAHRRRRKNVHGGGPRHHERKQTEESLRKSAQYENLFKHSTTRSSSSSRKTRSSSTSTISPATNVRLRAHEFIGSSLKTISANVANGRKYIDRAAADDEPSCSKASITTKRTPLRRY
jgi:PAS domain S-box-containing protein